MGTFIGILTLVVIIIGIFFGPAAQIEWTIYLGLPLVIFAGSVGVAFITRRLEAIILGMVIWALWPVLIEAVKLI